MGNEEGQRGSVFFLFTSLFRLILTGQPRITPSPPTCKCCCASLHLPPEPHLLLPFNFSHINISTQTELLLLPVINRHYCISASVLHKLFSTSLMVHIYILKETCNAYFQVHHLTVGYLQNRFQYVSAQNQQHFFLILSSAVVLYSSSV